MRKLVAGVALLLAACGEQEPAHEAGPAGSAWQSAVVLEASAKLGGCAVGDLIPNIPGDDIAAVAADGSIYVVVEMHVNTDRVWDSLAVAKADGEMIQCAIGDADPTRPGNEIVAVGMKAGGEEDGGPGAAHLVFLRENGSLREGDWRIEPIFEDSALIHGVCVADVDPDHAGNEVVTVGFSENAVVLGKTADGWKTLATVPLGSPGKNAVAWKDGAAVACAGGTVMYVHRTADGVWVADEIDRAETGQARLATDGERLLVARDDGALALITGEGKRTIIHRETMKLRGAVLADIDPRVDGLEAATAGYEKKMTVLYSEPEGWRSETVFEDPGRFHHLASGHFIDRGDGGKSVTLVGCGYSKRVIVVWRR